MKSPQKLTEELIQAHAPKAKVSKKDKGAFTVFLVAWDDLRVELSLLKNWADKDVQKSGMKGYITTFPNKQQKTKQVRNLITHIDSAKLACGIKIEPGYDSEGRVSKLLTSLAAKTDAFIFSFQSFYSSNGKLIIGRVGDPANLMQLN